MPENILVGTVESVLAFCSVFFILIILLFVYGASNNDDEDE